MIPRDHITEWRARAPWVEDFQVEQDLVSSRALVEIFSHAHIRKFDPATGEMIDDKRVNGELIDRRDRRPGHWRAEMVTLPLVAPVRELQAGDATYPVEHSPFATLLS